MEVFEQCGQRHVPRRQQSLLHAGEVVPVCVPASGVDGDAAYANFDQSPCQQTRLPQTGTSVTIAGVVAFAAEVEGAAGVWRAKDIECLLIELVHAVDVVVGPINDSKGGVEFLHQCGSRIDASRFHAGGRTESPDTEVFGVGVFIHLEWAVSDAQVAGRFAATGRPPDGHRDKRRNTNRCTVFLRDDRSDVGITQ